jgi:four helix bundle protein
MGISRFEDFEAWKASRKLGQTLDRVVAESRTFTNRRLLNQMEDCADSAMSNFVEGFDARSDPEFVRFLKIAFRSVSEFQSHLYRAQDQRQIDKAAFTELYDLATQAKALIGGLMRNLKSCIRQSKRQDRR